MSAQKCLARKGREIRIISEGKSIKAFEGETLGAALHRSGLRVFSRSFKYRRARGLSCFSGRCGMCVVNVNGVPNVRACITPVEDGMVVKRQKGWPSTDMDFLSFFLNRIPVKAGFQYKSGIHLWPIYKFAYSKITGAGKLPTETPAKDKGYSCHEMRKDVIVVGGGPAGLAAMLELKDSGMDTILVEQLPWLGGNLALFRSHKVVLQAGASSWSVEDLSAQISDNSILENTVATAFYNPDMLIALKYPRQLYQLEAKKFVFATGGYEDLPIIENIDLPGVFTFRGALIMTNGFGLSLGERGVIVGNGELARMAQREFERAGTTVTMVPEQEIIGVLGKKHVTGVLTKGSDRERKTQADFVVVATGLSPQYELPYQAGSKVGFDKRLQSHVAARDAYMRSTEVTYLAGGICGQNNFQAAFDEGRIAALSALYDLTKEERYLARANEIRGENS